MKKVKEILFVIIIVIGLIGVYKGLVLLDNIIKTMLLRDVVEQTM